MNILQLKKTDALNGPGVRASIWVSGCSNACVGCWAEDTWNPNQGIPYKELENNIVEAATNPNISGVSLLGGDPFYWAIEKNDGELLTMLKLIKFVLRKDQTIWAWTGYLYEELIKNEYAKECLKYIDVLVDGKFNIDKKDLSLKYRGSSNQRILNLTNLRHD